MVTEIIPINSKTTDPKDMRNSVKSWRKRKNIRKQTQSFSDYDCAICPLMNCLCLNEMFSKQDFNKKMSVAKIIKNSRNTILDNEDLPKIKNTLSVRSSSYSEKLLNSYSSDEELMTSVGDREVSLSEEIIDMPDLWMVNGITLEPGQMKPKSFSYVTSNVVLAIGSNKNNRLDIEGEDEAFVYNSLSFVEQMISKGELNSESDPLLVIGAGLSAADAILLAYYNNISVIHVFRRSAYDRNLIFNKLPSNMYPEYHKVHQMMKDKGRSYKGYTAYPQCEVSKIYPSQKVKLIGSSSEIEITVSSILVAIGSTPDLGILPDDGLGLGTQPEEPIHPKLNPIDINLSTYETVNKPGLYALGPLVGDNFVRFLQGGALAVASSIIQKTKQRN